MKYCLYFLAFMFSSELFADATINTNPSISTRSGVKGSACSNTYEESVSSTGESLFCSSSKKWIPAGQNGFQTVKNFEWFSAADNYKTKIVIAQCPAGKTVIGGNCNFNGYTFRQKNILNQSDGNSAWWCFFSLADAYNPSPGQFNMGMSIAHCVSKI